MGPYRSATGGQPPTRGLPIAAAFRAVVVPFAVSRGAVLLIGLVAATLIGYDPPPTEQATWRVAADPVRNLLARWDTFWYLDIASRGYQWNGNPLEQQNVVFFPLYPLLMRLSGALLGGHPLAGGLAVSLLAFLFALVYLWRLVADQFGTETATAAVVLLCSFPFAVFFSAVYTESVFLLIIVAAFFHARRREFGTAAVWGLLAGLARPNGFLLAVPMAWLAIIESRDDARSVSQKYEHAPSRPAPPAKNGRNSCGRPARSALLGARGALRGRAPRRDNARGYAMRALAPLAIVAPIAGVLLYSAYLKLAVGQAFAWVSGQAAWPTIAPWTKNAAASILRPAEPISPWDVVVHVGNAASIGIAAAGLLPLTRLLGIAYGVFVALNILPPIARHGLVSLGRFTSVMFPLFVWLATSVQERRRRALVIAFAIGQAIAATLFFTWRPLV